jgi:hypothetical protein
MEKVEGKEGTQEEQPKDGTAPKNPAENSAEKAPVSKVEKVTFLGQETTLTEAETRYKEMQTAYQKLKAEKEVPIGDLKKDTPKEEPKADAGIDPAILAAAVNLALDERAKKDKADAEEKARLASIPTSINGGGKVDPPVVKTQEEILRDYTNKGGGRLSRDAFEDPRLLSEGERKALGIK